MVILAKSKIKTMKTAMIMQIKYHKQVSIYNNLQDNSIQVAMNLESCHNWYHILMRLASILNI